MHPRQDEKITNSHSEACAEGCMYFPEKDRICNFCPRFEFTEYYRRTRKTMMAAHKGKCKHAIKDSNQAGWLFTKCGISIFPWAPWNSNTQGMQLCARCEKIEKKE